MPNNNYNGKARMSRVLLVSPIFTAMNHRSKEYNKLDQPRVTEYQGVKLEVSGAQPNTSVDLILFMHLIELFEFATDPNNITISLKLALGWLGYESKHIDDKRRKIVEASLDRMVRTSLKITYKNGSKASTNVINGYFMSEDKKSITIKMLESVRELYTGSYRRYVTLSTISNLSPFARALYLYTRAIGNKRVAALHENFIEFFNKGNKKSRYLSNLSSACEELQKNKIINSFFIDKDGVIIEKRTKTRAKTQETVLDPLA